MVNHDFGWLFNDKNKLFLSDSRLFFNSLLFFTTLVVIYIILVCASQIISVITLVLQWLCELVNNQPLKH